MEWFKKVRLGLKPQKKREIPDGLWTKCESCGEIIYKKELEKNLWICPQCGYHFRISSKGYIRILLDEGRLEEHDADLQPRDPLNFKDSKRYPDRVAAAQKKTTLKEAAITGLAQIERIPVSFTVLEFGFIGGSMGSIVGEKVARSIERAIHRKFPLVIVSASGGARMQEGILSLMQMVKTSALLAELGDHSLPYISVLTNPTTAGVMASFASLGDIIIAEPKALLGFAGPRVIKQTIGEDLPPGFQTSEFFLEHGFVDIVSPRPQLKRTIALCLRHLL